jgi:hypothetical protein
MLDWFNVTDIPARVVGRGKPGALTQEANTVFSPVTNNVVI